MFPVLAPTFFLAPATATSPLLLNGTCISDDPDFSCELGNCVVEEGSQEFECYSSNGTAIPPGESGGCSLGPGPILDFDGCRELCRDTDECVAFEVGTPPDATDETQPTATGKCEMHQTTGTTGAGLTYCY